MAGYVMYLEFKDREGVICLEGIVQNLYRFPPISTPRQSLSPFLLSSSNGPKTFITDRQSRFTDYLPATLKWGIRASLMDFSTS